jgi:nucleoside-diphosphate-sugar epimerase
MISMGAPYAAGWLDARRRVAARIAACKDPSRDMNLEGARIAVTGATGFLGRYIADVLLARGAQVVGVVRNPDKVPDLARRGVELRRADLAERAQLAAGFAGADAVVSNAALFSLGNQRWADHHRANIEGTRNVFGALADAGVRRVVHVSSVAVYGLGARGRLDEDAPQLSEASRRFPWSVYAISKALSEQEAWRLRREHGLALTTVRPCTIYGAFDPNFTPVFRRLVTLPLTVMPVFMRMSFVYGGDVAEGIARALEHDESMGRAYNLTGDGESAWELAAAWRAAGGRAAWLTLPVPVPFRPQFDSRRAHEELGWRPRPMVEAWRDTFAREGVG